MISFGLQTFFNCLLNVPRKLFHTALKRYTSLKVCFSDEKLKIMDNRHQFVRYTLGEKLLAGETKCRIP
jgi:hypothetical protein